MDELFKLKLGEEKGHKTVNTEARVRGVQANCRLGVPSTGRGQGHPHPSQLCAQGMMAETCQQVASRTQPPWALQLLPLPGHMCPEAGGGRPVGGAFSSPGWVLTSSLKAPWLGASGANSGKGGVRKEACLAP